MRAISCIAAMLLAGTAGTARANTITTPFSISGDFAVGSEENIGVPLPAGGTSGTVAATLTWGEPFTTTARPPATTEILLTFASLTMFDQQGNPVAAQECAITPYPDSPIYDNYSPCAPTNIQRPASTFGVSETDSFNFSYVGSPQTAFFSISAFAVCIGCILGDVEDAGGTLSGTITTDPSASVPEPAGLWLLGVGLLALVTSSFAQSYRRR